MSETIAAIATGRGAAGIGIVRVSGPLVPEIARAVLGTIPKIKMAHVGPFYGKDQHVLDEGVALYFKAPHSFTGEDILELQGHGGHVVLDRVLHATVELGARLARPGEFSERAFLNNKIDLNQAEAIADLIHSSSEQAAISAINSLQGQFSQQIHTLVQALIELRVFVEACIDFPDEDIEFIEQGDVLGRIKTLREQINTIKNSAKQGVLLQEGMTVVLVGKPNAGKSSLLNQLSGQDQAIVTDIPGTTRDILTTHIQIDGMPLHVMDTAGLREGADTIEQIGIQKAFDAMQKAHRILLLQDITEQSASFDLPAHIPVTTIYNKIDLSEQTARISNDAIYLSAKTGDGVDLLRQYLKDTMGYSEQQDGFIARRRHLDALNQALAALDAAQNQQAPELIAEDLNQASQCLGAITGEFTTDDLLGEIFSNFCIGK